MDAELIYFFRHALMRDAAYQLQLPTRRARLHELTLEVMEKLIRTGRLALDQAAAADLADHAHFAQRARGKKLRDFVALEIEYRNKAATLAALREDLGAAVVQLQQIVVHPKCPSRERALARISLGNRMFRQAQIESARRELEQALAEARLQADGTMIATAEIELANISQATGSVELARSYFSSALSFALVSANAKLESVARGGLAGLDYSAGLPSAEQGFAAALAASERAKDTTNQAIQLQNLGVTMHWLGREAEGLATLERAFDLAHSLGRLRLAATISCNIAHHLEEAGQVAESIQKLSVAESLARETGAVLIAAKVLEIRSRIAQRQGHLDQAQQQLQEAIAIAVEAGHLKDLAIYHARLAIVLNAAGHHAKANEIWARAASDLLAFGMGTFVKSYQQEFEQSRGGVVRG